MNIVVLAICLAIILVIVVGGWRAFTSKTKNPQMPLTVFGVGVVGYNENQMTREEAKAIANELAVLKDAALLILERVYGTRKLCAIHQLKIDTSFYKTVEWEKVHNRIMTVNPTKINHKVHFIEEIHNLYRIELHGYPYRYAGIDELDKKLRKSAQKALRTLSG